jgi:hypothetical protein
MTVNFGPSTFRRAKGTSKDGSNASRQSFSIHVPTGSSIFKGEALFLMTMIKYTTFCRSVCCTGLKLLDGWGSSRMESMPFCR